MRWTVGVSGPPKTLDDLRREMEAAGLHPGDLLTDGQIHRCPSDGDKGSKKAGWYVVYVDDMTCAAYGCWRSGLRETWCSGGAMGIAERHTFDQRVAKAHEARELERQQKREDAAAMAAARLNQAENATDDHPYLTAKKVTAYGLAEHRGSLLIPMRDADGKLWSLQFITPKGDKWFLPGGRVAGCMHWIGRPEGLCYLVEGYATGATVWAATGRPVCVAFDAGNLPKVAAALEGRGLSLVVAGDADVAGRTAVERTGLRGAFPAIEGQDWNDVGHEQGLEAVKAGLEAGSPAQRWRLITPEDAISQPAPPKWLVRGLLEQAVVADIFGASGSLKSFLGLSVGLAVSSGEPWFGRDVDQGAVAYLAGEGHRGVRRRVKAWSVKNGPIGRFFTASGALSVMDNEQFALLIEGLDAVHKAHELRLVIVDTLARWSAGAEENSAKDMGMFAARLDAIKDRYGCAVVVVHHTGHAHGERARGSSAWYGALDASMRVERPDGNKTAANVHCEKAKDAEPFESFSFSCSVVDTGWVDDEGAPSTSLVVDSVGDVGVAPKPKGAALGKLQKAALAMLAELLRRAQKMQEARGGVGAPPGVDLQTWRREVSASRQAWAAMLEALCGRELVRVDNGLARLTETGWIVAGDMPE